MLWSWRVWAVFLIAGCAGSDAATTGEANDGSVFTDGGTTGTSSGRVTGRPINTTSWVSEDGGVTEDADVEASMVEASVDAQVDATGDSGPAPTAYHNCIDDMGCDAGELCRWIGVEGSDQMLKTCRSGLLNDATHSWCEENDPEGTCPPPPAGENTALRCGNGCELLCAYKDYTCPYGMRCVEPTEGVFTIGRCVDN